MKKGKLREKNNGHRMEKLCGFVDHERAKGGDHHKNNVVQQQSGPQRDSILHRHTMTSEFKKNQTDRDLGEVEISGKVAASSPLAKEGNYQRAKEALTMSSEGKRLLTKNQPQKTGTPF